MDFRTLLSGIVLGAAGALVLDPGRRWRARRPEREIREIRASRFSGEVLDTTMHDLAIRSRGGSESRGWLPDWPIDDRRLLERVRARLGRVCSHPHAVEVDVADGQVTLRGAALAAEVKDMLAAAAGVRGVHSVINELEPHDSPELIPDPPKDDRARPGCFESLQLNRVLAARALAGAAVVAAGGLALTFARR